MGLDLSLTSTGVALPDGTLALIRTKPTARDVVRRASIACDVAVHVHQTRPDMLVIESLPTGRAFSIVALAKLHAIVEQELYGNVPSAFAPTVLWVTPQQRAGWATGAPGSRKEAVVTAALAEGAPIPDSPKAGRDDLADAWWLRTIGLAVQGEWVVERRPHRAALVDRLTGVAA